YQLARKARKNSHTNRQSSNNNVFKLTTLCDGGTIVPKVFRLNISMAMTAANHTKIAVRYSAHRSNISDSLSFQASCKRKAGRNTTAINFRGIKTLTRAKPIVRRTGRSCNTRHVAIKKTAYARISGLAAAAREFRNPNPNAPANPIAGSLGQVFWRA